MLKIILKCLLQIISLSRNILQNCNFHQPITSVILGLSHVCCFFRIMGSIIPSLLSGFSEVLSPSNTLHLKVLFTLIACLALQQRVQFYSILSLYMGKDYLSSVQLEQRHSFLWFVHMRNKAHTLITFPYTYMPN